MCLNCNRLKNIEDKGGRPKKRLYRGHISYQGWRFDSPLAIKVDLFHHKLFKYSAFPEKSFFYDIFLYF